MLVQPVLGLVGDPDIRAVAHTVIRDAPVDRRSFVSFDHPPFGAGGVGQPAQAPRLVTADAWWTHSRLACVAGLNQLAELAPRADATRFRELAGALLAETSRRCQHPDGHWQRSPDDQRVDAALLLPPLRGALSAQDPRTIATLEAVRRDLVDDGYVYRYAVPGRPLGEAEGAFLLCGFMLALADLQQANMVEAYRWFERNRAACGPPGLLAEEYDVEQRQLRGNLPQAFVHALLLETSVRLTKPH